MTLHERVFELIRVIRTSACLTDTEKYRLLLRLIDGIRYLETIDEDFFRPR